MAKGYGRMRYEALREVGLLCCIIKSMYYVYILRNANFDQVYTGFTNNLKKRLVDHNAGRSKHTKKFRPWNLIAYTAFENESKARSYEEYLKTGSGIAFARRHIL